jgi:hypothetical protein
MAGFGGDDMEFPQSTLEEITESEVLMVRTAADRFGNFFLNAWACSVLLSKCVVSVDHTRLHFARFHAVLKKHHTLSVLSFVRLHKVQGMMDLRQALEAGCAAAFAIANPEDDHFFRIDQHGIVRSSQSLSDKRYRWLDRNFKQRSDGIKAKKKLINDNQSHANIVMSDTGRSQDSKRASTRTENLSKSESCSDGLGRAFFIYTDLCIST